MFGYFSTIQTSKDDETLSLLHHHPSKRLPYKRWIIFSLIFLIAVNFRFASFLTHRQESNKMHIYSHINEY